MADTIDQAQAYTEVFDAAAHIAHMTRTKEAPPDGWDGASCVDCFEEIPSKRIELVGAIRCVHCQTKRERRP